MSGPTRAITYSSHQDRYKYLSQVRMVTSVSIFGYPNVNRLGYKLCLRSVNYLLIHSNRSVLRWYALLSSSSWVLTLSSSLDYLSIQLAYQKLLYYLKRLFLKCVTYLVAFTIAFTIASRPASGSGICAGLSVHSHDFEWLLCTRYCQIVIDG